MSSYGAWNTSGVAQWQAQPWQYAQGPFDAQANASTKLPAIGSERRQSTASNFRPPRASPILTTHRPPSWQDEIGEAKPKSPYSYSAGSPSPHPPDSHNASHYQSRPLKPYDWELLNGRTAKSRSSSTPAADAVKPNVSAMASRLRHLSMSNTAGRQDARDATRSSLRLTKSPTEFVPSSMRNMTPQIPENAVVGQFSQQFEDVFAHQLPKTSARPAQPSVSQRPAQHSRETSGGTDERGVLDPQTGLHRVQQEPPRDTNMKEIRERHSTPPPRPGSPDDWRSSTMDEFADRMLSLQSSHPPMAPLQPMEYPRELAAVYETPEFHAQERTYYMELLHTETPESPEKARSIGIGAYGYRLLKMRDTVRRTFPNSTFPLLNGDKVGDTEVSNYPEEIQEAFYNPPPLPQSQFVVVTFKHHRAEVFLHPEAMKFVNALKLGDMVVVQADRGENVGQVWHICENMLEAERVARSLNSDQLNNLLNFSRTYAATAKSLAPLQSNFKVQSQPSWIIRRAEGRYLLDLQRKEHDETKAKRIAAQKADEMGFPLEILDTEFQIDHQKLTIYYISADYVRFKELVNNIYKIYKMRIWMSSVNPQHPPDMYDDF